MRYERSVIYTGYMDGRSDGLAEGRAEGREEGRAEGREEGRVEGIIETNKSHAKAMRENGIQVSIISQITGLSIDEIDKL